MVGAVKKSEPGKRFLCVFEKVTFDWSLKKGQEGALET